MVMESAKGKPWPNANYCRGRGQEEEVEEEEEDWLLV
jgi:hypothetical protein